MKSRNIFLLIASSFLLFSCHRASDTGHENENEETHYHPEHIEGVTYDTVRKAPFSEIIKTGGKILAGNENITLITAKSGGVVRFAKPAVYPGMKTDKGQVLFLISGSNLAEDNAALRLEQLRSDLERAKTNYERAQKLIPEKIITREHFLAAKNEYEKVLAEYNNLSINFRENEAISLSPATGFIREIFISEGQKVSSGDPLASVQTFGGMVLKALLPPDKIKKASSVRNAWFRAAGSEKIYKTEELNGKIISYGKSTGENSFYVPVFFSIDYIPELIEGTFAEVYLRCGEISDALTVPVSALMEEFGRLYVFVKDGDGNFVKHYIKTGYSDGERTLVTEGLEENEVIATGNAYMIKLQQMTGSAPAHTHNH